MLLACCSVFLGVVSRLHLTGSLPVSFALYGLLHALALVLALRARQAIWRRCLFIVIAASLSVMTLRFGLFGRQLSGAPPGIVGLYSLLGLAAAIGAVAYGILIRLFGMYALTAASLAAIAVGCVLAAFVALFTVSHFHFFGPWWLAVLWWYAFSGALWYFDQRHHRASPGRDPGRQ
jgi:hypothetical protein